jgi:hypothetical protein
MGMAGGQTPERWGVYEIKLVGPAAGNPFVDVRLSAHFRYRNRVIDADGFLRRRRRSRRLDLHHVE